MSTPRYDLLAIDLDGTLVNSSGRISQRNIDALHEARARGMGVMVCTGRGLAECRAFLDAIGQEDAVAVAGGSIIADPTTARTLHRFAMDPELVSRAARCMIEHDHPALVLKDPLTAGFDYLVVHGEDRLPLDPVMEWWFSTMNLRVRYTDQPEADEHPAHTVRVGAFGFDDRVATIAQRLAREMHGRAQWHHFPAVVGPGHHERLAQGRAFHILELFDAEANKWSAVRWLAAQRGIDPSRIAAIGDEINDVSMIEGAGLGVAMGNAIDRVKACAGRVTERNDDDGAARAIERIMRGEW